MLKINKACFYLLLLGFLLNFCFSFTQELPPITNYTPQQYGGENQNWAITQSDDKSVYIANNKGLLEFNGSHWQLYPSPNESIMRTVKVIGDRIYTGCYMEFGYWVRDNNGILNYTSLSQQLKEPMIEDEHFWDVLDLENFVLFQSLNRIYIYNVQNNAFSTIDSESTITKMFRVDNKIMFHQSSRGLYEIVNGNPKLVSNDEILINNIVINAYKFNEGLMIQTNNDGIYMFDDNELSAWEVPANETISQNSVYNSVALANGNVAIGTISDGLIVINREGEIIYRFNQESGLNNNTVLSLVEDTDHNLWLGLDDGIACINENSPFAIYTDTDDNLGTVYAVAEYKNTLYLGTNQGLFYRDLSKGTNFNFIEGTEGQVWCLVEINDALFCGHNFGTFLISDQRATKISDIEGTWDIKPIQGEKDLLVQGNYNGFHVLQNNNGIWELRNKIEGFDMSSKHFEFLNNTQMFVSHEYKGVFKIEIDKNYRQVLNIEKDKVSKGAKSSLVKFNDQILYAYKDGIYNYNKETATFEMDSLLSSDFSKNYISGELIATGNSNDELWSFTDTNINFIKNSNLSNEPQVLKIPIPSNLRHSLVGYECVTQLDDRNYIIGSTSGYFVLNLDMLSDKTNDIKINSIVNSDSKGQSTYLDLDSEFELASESNNLQIRYSSAAYDKFQKPHYQYQLVGMYDQWSDWSQESVAVFNNLPFGKYTFNVRAKVGNSISQNTASYNFKIKKPWFLSNTMIGVYILVVIIFSIIMHNIYKAYYKRQREKLIQKNQRDLELKELENKQQLMRHKNERLELDIEGKNRELAISTMSLIKKNEFLNEIKERLKKVNPNDDLKHVIKVIDNNLNNTDDWKLFEQAFNNADKDFLKKVKEKHNSLTPNDLRLCAYLRLNLSSKEIAPLLNISPRSVEVKRYRLRKKMNLPHESSLTNYILEI